MQKKDMLASSTLCLCGDNFHKFGIPPRPLEGPCCGATSAGLNVLVFFVCLFAQFTE